MVNKSRCVSDTEKQARAKLFTDTNPAKVRAQKFFGPQTWLKLSSKIDGGVAEMWRLERC